MENRNYFRVRIHRITETVEDILTTQAIEMGSTGVSEVLNFSQPDLTYEPDVVYSRFHEVDVFFESPPPQAFFDYVRSLGQEITWDIFEEASKDWLEEWKKGFEAFCLVRDVWVVPSWLKAPAECKIPLFIDPGMAFGTGTHATTQIAAALLHRLKKDQLSQKQNGSLMDVGTGTAILAMLAAQIGFTKVVGLEIDPEARRTARQNIERNQLLQINISDKPLEEFRGPFDVVVANIIDGILIHLRKELLRVLGDGSYIILSGILLERDNYFFENFISNSPLKVLRRIEKEEWVGYLLQKIEIEKEN